MKGDEAMAATWQEISSWFDEGAELGATHMIVVCDTFEYDDYPVFVEPGKTARDVAGEYRGNMQRVMECYDLRMDKDTQMCEYRALHWD